MYMFWRGASRSRPLWSQNPNDRQRHWHRYHHTACRVGKSDWRTDNHAGYRSQWYAIDDVGRKHRVNHQLNLDHVCKRHDDRLDYWYRLRLRLNLEHATGQNSSG
jgi:hypothetical protein